MCRGGEDDPGHTGQPGRFQEVQCAAHVAVQYVVQAGLDALAAEMDDRADAPACLQQGLGVGEGGDHGLLRSAPFDGGRRGDVEKPQRAALPCRQRPQLGADSARGAREQDPGGVDGASGVRALPGHAEPPVSFDA